MTIAEKLKLMDAIKQANRERDKLFIAKLKEGKRNV